MNKKVYTFLQQAFVFALIMLISNGLSFLIQQTLDIPLPSSVIGLVLLFASLSLNIVKLEQVEELSTNLTSIIAFLFVPSGISLINSLDIMQQFGIQILLVLLVAILVLLAVTGWSADFFLKLKNKKSINQMVKEEL